MLLAVQIPKMSYWFCKFGKIKFGICFCIWRLARQHLTDFAFSPLCALLRRQLSGIGDATQGCNVCHLGEHGGDEDDDEADDGGDGGHEDEDGDEIMVR